MKKSTRKFYETLWEKLLEQKEYRINTKNKPQVEVVSAVRGFTRFYGEFQEYKKLAGCIF